MQIKVTQNNKVLYQQLLDSDETMNVTIAHLMQQPQGDKVLTEVENNGHVLKFSNETLDVERLIRRVNGIVIRSKKR